MITPGSVQIVGVTDAGFSVVLSGYSTPRDLASATLTFSAASGATLSSAGPVPVPLGTASLNWFAGAEGQKNGGRFVLHLPFTLQGSSAALGQVNVALSNSVGSSASVTGGR